MRRTLRTSMLVIACASLPGAAGGQGAGFDVPRARVSGADQGGALTLPSTASPTAVLQQYLRAQGRDEATVASVRETSRAAGRDGVTHTRFEQRAGGLAVYGTYAKATLSARGELLHVVENLAPVPRSVARAQVSAQQAIDAAVAHLYPALRTVPAGFFRSAPTATRVAVPYPDGSMSAGFLVETWTNRTNELNYTLVDAAGSVLEVESRTNRDSYNVFHVNPDVTLQAQVNGPGAGNAESPEGWVFGGVQGSTHIAGNNVSAYLDVVSNNKSDDEGAPITDASFDTVADLDVSPSTPGNREVAVQNLFYLNNVIHDELYRHGFREGTGNFQEDNFDNGGRGRDPVDAEAQDGGGTDNANFATPPDGRSPRMQMYLWTGRGTHEVLAGGQVFKAQGAEFGPSLDTTGTSGTIQLVNDGTGTTSDGCEAIPANALSGAIALLDRGTCAFTVKVKNAQDAGAVAAIVANNQGDSIILMGGTDATIIIPSVFVGQSVGTTLKSMAPTAGTVRLADPPPLQRDGDLDADIVFHEYCHGLTWRMIGRMRGALAGAIGEGMSDICAVLMTSQFSGADVVAEYSASDPRGIRRFPYDGYPNTYSDVIGASVHNDGEIYAAIGWRLLELFGEDRKDDLFGYLVDGMNYTPAQPTYEEMRDGILSSVAISPKEAGDDCLVWSAFAEFGVGVGASGQPRGPSVVITESFAVPSSCQVP